MSFNRFIIGPGALVTTHEQTRAGFLSIALEKNRLGDPYVQNAYAFRAMASAAKRPEELLDMEEVRPFLIAASGLSDKSLNYLDETDRTIAIQELIENFLKPAGEKFLDEAIYRYLLIKGDSVGGSMRNRIGALGKEKLTRSLLSTMHVRGIRYMWTSNFSSTVWNCMPEQESDGVGIEGNIKALSWENVKGPRTVAFDLKLPIVTKNIDITVFDVSWREVQKGKIVNRPERILMCGELKSGIDPAGADEHWKTGNSALERIRTSFSRKGLSVKTSFVGAAIENSMAEEIFEQLTEGKMDNAANLNNPEQLTEYCNWVLDL